MMFSAQVTTTEIPAITHLRTFYKNETEESKVD